MQFERPATERGPPCSRLGRRVLVDGANVSIGVQQQGRPPVPFARRPAPQPSIVRTIMRTIVRTSTIARSPAASPGNEIGDHAPLCTGVVNVVRLRRRVISPITYTPSHKPHAICRQELTMSYACGGISVSHDPFAIYSRCRKLTMLNLPRAIGSLGSVGRANP